MVQRGRGGRKRARLLPFEIKEVPPRAPVVVTIVSPLRSQDCVSVWFDERRRGVSARGQSIRVESNGLDDRMGLHSRGGGRVDVDDFLRSSRGRRVQLFGWWRVFHGGGRGPFLRKKGSELFGRWGVRSLGGLRRGRRWVLSLNDRILLIPWRGQRDGRSISLLPFRGRRWWRRLFSSRGVKCRQ